MTSEDTRLARLRRECDFSAGPAWLLAAACAVLLLVLGLNVLLGETASTQVDGTTPPSVLQIADVFKLPS